MTSGVPKKSGFTLIELLIGLAILGILLFFSLFETSTLHDKNQLQIMADEIKGAINLAKTEALLTGEALTLTPLIDSTDWSEGLLLFVDNKKHRYTSDTRLLHEWHWKAVGLTAVWHGFQSNDYLIFSTAIQRSTTNGYFEITTPTHQKARLVVNRLGRVRSIP